MTDLKINERYIPAVRTALTAAAAVGPVGVFGNIDAVAVGAVWAKMLYDLQQESNVKLSNNPKRVATGIAMGVAGYYVGSKIASWLCFLIPGAGIFIGMSLSTIVNVYFTYRLALILISLMDDETALNDDEIIKYVVSLLKKYPSLSEVKEIVSIYKTWTNK